MAVRIKFDASHNVIQPTFVLATRSGKKLGIIQADDIEISDSMNSYFEVNFKVQKENDGVVCPLWDKIEDFKLLWCREWNVWFEIYVETFEENNTVKNINAISLGEAELSSTKLHGIEINTETDISRDDYVVTVLYNEENKEGSLLHRIMEKVPHYSIHYVSQGLVNIQRTFTFDGISIYDAFQEIAKEINCIFVINSGSDMDGYPIRQVEVHDLESYCTTCGYRDIYFKTCPSTDHDETQTGRDTVLPGYGEDTTIFITTENLADNITFSTDKDSVMNCFKLEGGDDLMTAAIMSCNPNGSAYIWYVSDLMKRDMSEELITQLEEYDKDYNYYQTEHEVIFDSSEQGTILSKNRAKTFQVKNESQPHGDIEIGDVVYFECSDKSKASVTYKTESGTKNVSFGTTQNSLSHYTASLTITSDITEFSVNEYVTVYYTVLPKYNELAEKYHKINENILTIKEPIVGYPALMNAYYDTIDLEWYLESELMPTVKTEDTTVDKEAAKLSEYFGLSTTFVAVQDLESCSKSTATSAVLAMAKVIVDKRYQVKVKNDAFTEQYDPDGNFLEANWDGILTITNYSNENETTTVIISVPITDDYEAYVKQKLEKALTQEDVGSTDIISLFDGTLEEFEEAIKMYCLSSLEVFRDACQTCLDVMVEQGIANDESWSKKEIEAQEKGEEIRNLYNDLYLPYYHKSLALNDEIAVREAEIALIVGTYDIDGDIVTEGLQTILEKEKNKIQEALDFEKFLGDLWLEFIAYRREDVYSNENYISDGLNNKELFNRALEFVENAKKEIYKSSTLQHSITATLKNLLVMKEFEPILEYFAVGNWIRVKINDEIYRLRLISYTIDFNNLDNITIEFSDVLQCANGISDVESILNQAASLTKGYPSVSHQASKGDEAKKQLDDWVERSMALTKMKIVDDADNQNITWDSHGILCREYSPITETYSDKQLKIINRGLYLTNDGWLTSKAGIGDFVYYDPVRKEMVEAYGVIADTLVGNLILSEEVGIYNMNNSVTIDKNGLTITTHYEEDEYDNITTSGNNALLVQKEVILADGSPSTEQLMYLDDKGNLVLNGTIRVNTTTSSGGDKDITLDDICDEDRINNIVSNKVNEETVNINNTIEGKYKEVMDEVDYQLWEYKAEVGQYMQYDEDGLTLGSTGSTNKTVIDNTGIRFKQNNATVSYITNNQLLIPNAVIENILVLGKFCFCPRTDGGMSLTWQEDIQTVDNTIISVKIKSDDKNQTVKVGETATFTAIVTGDKDKLKYQWKYTPYAGSVQNGTEILSDWNVVGEQLETTFTFTPSSIADNKTTIGIDIFDETGSRIVWDETILTVVEESSGGSSDSGNEGESGGSTGDDEIGNITNRNDIVVGTAQNFSAVSWAKGVSYGTQTAKYSTDVEVLDGTVKLKSASTESFYMSTNSSENNYDILLGKFVEGKYGGIYYIDSAATYNHLKEDSDLGERIVYSKAYQITANENWSGNESEDPDTSDATVTNISVSHSSGSEIIGTSINDIIPNITVTAIYSDGSQKKVQDFDVNGQTIVSGKNILTITYEGIKTTLAINGIEQSSGGNTSSGLVMKTGTVTNSSEISTGLSSITQLILYRDKINSTGLVEATYDSDFGTMSVYCTSTGLGATGAISNTTPAVNGGIFTWKGTGTQAMTSGVAYTWVAFGEQ